MMTRSMNRPGSPKGRYSCIGSGPARLSDGGVCKRQPLSPTQRSVKVLAKDAMTQQECIAQLKRLLPKVGEEDDEKITELDLVERTIAYISYLESLLKANGSTKDSDGTVQSTVELLQKMAV